MFDMHSHILPRIDDGAKDLDVSLAMLKIAQNSGTKHIIATPHVIEGEWLPTWERVVSECEQLKAAAAMNGIDVNIYPGGEIAVYLDLLELFSGPGAYCINGGRYVLVELPITEIPGFAEEFFFTLQARGVTPILAHPERHPILGKKLELLAEWVNKGILLQMNGASIIGRMGERTMKIAELLLINNMVHCIGSDAHSARTRNPDLRPAVEKITSMVGREKLKQIMIDNPNKILHNCDVDIVEVKNVIYNQKTGGIRKWLTALWGNA